MDIYVWVLILLSLAIVWVLTQTKKETFNEYIYEGSRDYPHDDIEWGNNMNISACVDKCNAMPDCKKLVTDRVNTTENAYCWYKRNFTTGAGVSNSSRFSWTKKPVADKTNYFSSQDNKGVNGNDLLSINVSNISECPKWCETTAGCNGYTVFKGVNRCYLKSAMNLSTNNFFKAFTRTSDYGKCPDGSSKVDPEGSNCPRCPGSNVMKDENGYNCYGFCKDGVTYSTSPSGSNCPKCPGTKQIQSDATGSNCFGFCEFETPAYQIYKIDMEGTNCPKCEGSEIYKDKTGSNCYGMCIDGVTYKLDKDGTNCPKCENSNIYKNSTGSNCYGFCKDNVTYKIDDKGTNCFGLCFDGKTYKIDDKGTNCFGLCDDKETYKIDEIGSNCFGTCGDGSYKVDAIGTNCAATSSAEFIPLRSYFK